LYRASACCSSANGIISIAINNQISSQTQLHLYAWGPKWFQTALLYIYLSKEPRELPENLPPQGFIGGDVYLLKLSPLQMLFQPLE
jgi:hypothetical protein